MNNDTLKIAVFIDFDNIQIGVRNTLNRDFDLSLVLDALKERGEVVTKVAYGNWKRAGDLTRTLTQHAVLMVQRDLTPRGDKNGADINLALDALELAINQPHINAFVIVGGDSDFIALVEKLKQYNKAVFVVGGRSFTSNVLARNCREFIAYDNLLEGVRRDEAASRRREVFPLGRVVPLVYRALKLLRDREVQAQIGLLKSTLVQLDSTFNERDYGANSFRDFIQKMADAHLLNVRQQGNSYIVEPLEGEPPVEATDQGAASSEGEPVIGEPEPNGYAGAYSQPYAPPQQYVPPAPQYPPEEAVQLLQRVLEPLRGTNPRPLYLRNVKQMLRSEQPGFDEQQYGFQSIVDLLRAGQSQGMLRLQRDRRGALRVFIPGPPVPLATAQPVEAAAPIAPAAAPNGADGEAQPVEAEAAAPAPVVQPQRSGKDEEEDSQIAFLGYYRGGPGAPPEEQPLSLAAAVAAEGGGRKKRVRKPKGEGAPAGKSRRSRAPRNH